MDVSTQMSKPAGERNGFLPRTSQLPLAAFAFFGLTVIISLVLSHYSLMWYDEFLVLWTNSVPSLSQLLNIQLHSPISLHPFGYGPFVWSAIRFFGPGPFAIRLPSLCGYLLMQVCLYIFVRRAASDRTAVFALAFPALNTTLIYAVEGRPYALQLGWFALAMVSWQTAIRRESHRTLALVSLALAIFLAINTHFFGILILAPLCGAELFRTSQRKRIDLPVIAALGAGTAGIIAVVPFMKAVGQFHTHYYLKDGAHLDAVTATYLSILPGYGFTHRHLAIGIPFLAIVAIAVIGGCFRQARGGTINLTRAEYVCLILLGALPILGYLMTLAMSVPLEGRFVHGVVIGFSALAAIAIAPLLRHPAAGRVVLLALFIGIALFGFSHIRQFRKDAKEVTAGLVLAPDVKASLLSSPTTFLYIGATYEFARASYYEPDPEVRSHLALVYSEDQEMRWHQGDTAALTALHMRSFTGFNIIPFETMRKEPGEHLYVVNSPDHIDDWSGQALTADHASEKPLGSFAGGEVMSIRFPSADSSDK
jgi:hypothetical protein